MKSGVASRNSSAWGTCLDVLGRDLRVLTMAPVTAYKRSGRLQRQSGKGLLWRGLFQTVTALIEMIRFDRPLLVRPEARTAEVLNLAAPPKPLLLKTWRRGWDSNPRVGVLQT